MSTIVSLYQSLSSLFWQDPIAQTIGFIALLIGTSAFFHKDDQKLRYFLTAFTFLMAVHFFLLGLWTAGLMALLGSARNYVSSLTNSFSIMMVFIIVAWLLAIPNTHHWEQILPVIGVTLGTWGVFREKGFRMRLLMSLGTVCWLSHNYLVGSIGGAIIEAIFLFVNGRTMLKLLADEKVHL